MAMGESGVEYDGSLNWLPSRCKVSADSGPAPRSLRRTQHGTVGSVVRKSPGAAHMDKGDKAARAHLRWSSLSAWLEGAAPRTRLDTRSVR